MPFNGSGGTSQPGGGGFPAVASTLIQSAKVNISIADIYSMLATCLLKDGQQVATARIPFASGISTDTINEKTAGAGVTLGQVLNTPQGADIVCAATINLETATGNVVDVTGSTGPVTAITLSQGHWRIVRFTGTPTLTNGASLVLPGGANIVVAAGDYAIFIGYAASVVRCPIFFRAASLPATVTGTETLTNKTLTSPTLTNPTGSGTLTHNGLVDISGASGGQIKFPAAQNASADVNTLDDYEEGTWTPSLGGTTTYVAQTGTYTKIGRLVYVRMNLQINTIGTGSTFIVSGLPFAAAVTGAIAMGDYSSSATASVQNIVTVSSSSMNFLTKGAASAGTGVSALFGSGTQAQAAGTYEV